RTIDFERLQLQHGDDPPAPFSFATEKIAQKQVPCHITYTNHKTHEAIRASLHRSPIYSGIIHSRGPRYCPSIEDKIVRFADKERHQIFLEPEGLDTVEIYPNGLSTSLPLDAQIAMVHSIEGLERAEIMRPGYAIEYDYEEAAAQGLMAGLNAALSLRGEEPLIFKRDEAYIGVLIDDLVTKGTDGEPYRMFTSRAEYRLLLREDNADLRLTEIGHKIGAVGEKAYARLERKRDGVAALLRLLEQTAVSPDEASGKIEALCTAPIRSGTTLAQLLKRPEIGFAELRQFAPSLKDTPLDIALQAEVEIKYAGYIDRQLEAVKRAKNFESMRLPEDLDYAAVTGLSREAREKLARIRPRSLGQASRIAGITPAAISLLSV